MYEVIVGNIGSVYYGSDKDKAEEVYRRFVEESTTGCGRAKGEPVTLFKNDNIIKEYNQ